MESTSQPLESGWPVTFSDQWNTARVTGGVLQSLRLSPVPSLNTPAAGDGLLNNERPRGEKSLPNAQHHGPGHVSKDIYMERNKVSFSR